MPQRGSSLLPKKARSEPIEAAIRVIRGERVILDADLARLYGVKTRVLNQTVRRNREKFPPHFMFELTRTESKIAHDSPGPLFTNLKSQEVISSRGHRGKRRQSYQGCAFFYDDGALVSASCPAQSAFVGPAAENSDRRGGASAE